MANYKSMLSAIIFLVSATAVFGEGLKCYQCGTYSTAGTGSVSPCYYYDSSNLKECEENEGHCVKYVNEGIVVRQCAEHCKTGVEGLTEVYCCKKDACNRAPSFIALQVVVLLAISLAVVTFVKLQ